MSEKKERDNNKVEIPLINRRQERKKATKCSNLNLQASINSITS